MVIRIVYLSMSCGGGCWWLAQRVTGCISNDLTMTWGSKKLGENFRTQKATSITLISPIIHANLQLLWFITYNIWTCDRIQNLLSKPTFQQTKSPAYVPSRVSKEVRYPLPRHFWRWLSFPKVWSNLLIRLFVFVLYSTLKHLALRAPPKREINSLKDTLYLQYAVISTLPKASRPITPFITGLRGPSCSIRSLSKKQVT